MTAEWGAVEEQEVVDDLTAFSGGHRDFSVGVRPVSPAAQRSGTESCRSGKEALVDRETDDVLDEAETRLRAAASPGGEPRRAEAEIDEPAP
ncbi:hypothetical protein [Saccharopolyspora shandongensis]|uniref:hypothetical protein n=1 Tax=Saccharopolyspora shandongensis TaxID=418495 RepID=UPI00115FC3E5|nr:hypothetical protein [Saccharopolyspora shandongensis]